MSQKRRQKVKAARTAEAPVSLALPGNFWWVHLAILAGLFLINLILYQRVVDAGFLSVDDPDYILNNPYIEKVDGAKLKHILTTPYFANYAPANLLSYALDVALASGKKAAAIHSSSVVWHWWTACMVYLLAFTIRPRAVIAASAALLFVLHPAHVEVVAWISSRKDLVATGFAALAMTCYLRYRRRTKYSGVWYAGSIVSFLLASAGKQSVLLLPVVMLVWDFLVENRRAWQMIADKIPFGAITFFFGWMTWHAQPSTNQPFQPLVAAATELANAWLLTGLGKYTLYHEAPAPAKWGIAARVAVMAAAIGLWVAPLLFQRAKQPVRAALCYWALIQMVPPMLLSFVVPITDRYLFLPSVGVCILLADVGVEFGERWLRVPRIAWTFVAALALVWGVKTWSYVGEWNDPRSVWHGAHLKTRNSQVAQFLGEVYQNAGERVDGFVKSGNAQGMTNEIALAAAVLGDPERVERLRVEWTNGGVSRTNSAAYRDVLWGLAWEQFEQSLARRGTLSTPNLFMTRGRLLVSEGKYAQAIPEFQNALRFAENSGYDMVRKEGATQALFAIGVAYWNMGNYAEAYQWLLKAQAVQQKSGQVWLPALDKEVERLKHLAGK